MFTAEWGGQISWLIPAALIAIVVMLWVSRRAARTDRTRAAAILWGGWLVVAGLVLSFMSGTTHSYYAIALAPPIGALIGIGAATAWRIRHTWFARAAMAAALSVTAAWAWVLLARNPGWYPWLRVVIVIAAVGAAGLLLAGRALRVGTAREAMALAVVPVSLAAIAGLAGPLAYSLDTAATSYAGTSPSAGPPMTGAVGARGPGRGLAAGRGGFPGFAGGLAGERPGRFAGGFGGLGGAGGFGRGGNATVSSAFAKLLASGASHYTWAAATDGADSAASMELATGGVPVMAIGGFRGTDPAPSLARFEKLVSEHKIHYYVAGGGFGGRGPGGAGGGFGGAGASLGGGPVGRGAGGGIGGFRGFGGAGGPGGSSTDAAQISAWVQAHFTAQTVGGMTVYNLTAPAASS